MASSVANSNQIGDLFKKLIAENPLNYKSTIFRSVLSSSDEIIEYFRSFDGILKSEMIGAGIMFGVLMCFTIKKNFVSLYKGEINVKQFLKFLSTDAAAYGVTTACATAGAIMAGLLGPGGAAIGTVLGGIIGGLLSKNYCEEKIRELLNGKFLDISQDANLIKAVDIYLEAIRLYQVEDKSDKTIICNLRKNYLLLHHPDKNGSNEMFIKYENAFNIIKTFRELRGDWN